MLPALALLCACSTHPLTGRGQILALPAVQGAYADATFALATALPSCEHDCGRPQDLAEFAGRASAIGADLEIAAREVAPQLFARIAGFRIEVNEGLGMGTGSTTGGRIALGSGLAALQPTDTVIAFLVAREMAHVIARHAEENSGASIVLSALGLLVPGFHLVLRWVATAVGSGALRSSWAAQQQREADEIAVTLLELSGVPVLGYADSAQRVALIAASGPRTIASIPAGN
jgi:Zn-dependent protease with chaperone function